MRNATRHVSSLLFTLCVLLAALSVYSFWNAHEITRLLVEQAGDDPFAMVYTDATEVSPTMSQQYRELIMLNIRRRRSESAGWLSMVAGVLLLSSASILRARKRTPQTLGISESGKVRPNESDRDE